MPRAGTVAKVGFFVTATAGAPPAYNAGIFNHTSGKANTASPYGGSAAQAFNLTTGWNWLTLSSPATAVLGDFVSIALYPGATPPDGSNNVTVSRERIWKASFPGRFFY